MSVYDRWANYHTDPSRRVDSNKKTSPEQMRGLIEFAKYNINELNFHSLELWNAYINPKNVRKSDSGTEDNRVIVQLQTTSPHLYDFWVSNWFPAEEDKKPHGTIYAIFGVSDQKPFAWYCSELKTAVFMNTDYYGQCKSWALGLAADILEEKGIHSIHGSCVTISDKGIIMIAPTGTGKSTHCYKLLELPDTRIHSDDWLFVEERDKKSVATISERKFYIRTDAAEHNPLLRDLFPKCELENVVDDKENAKTMPVKRVKDNVRECVFDAEAEKCYWGFGNSRAILRPEAIHGPDRFIHECEAKYVFLFRRDRESKPIEKLSSDEAIEILKEGKVMLGPGSAPKEKWGQFDYEPWYNPYLLNKDNKAQEGFFRRLFDTTEVYILNTGMEDIETSQRRIREIVLP